MLDNYKNWFCNCLKSQQTDCISEILIVKRFMAQNNTENKELSASNCYISAKESFRKDVLRHFTCLVESD